MAGGTQKKAKGKNKKNSKRKLFEPILFLIAFFILVRLMLSLGGKEDFYEHHKINKEKGVIIISDEITDYKIQSDESDYYFSLDFVKKYIDPHIFWDEPEGRLTVTTKDKVIRMKSQELEYYVNNEPFTLDMPFYIDNNEPYIPSKALSKLYNINVAMAENSGILSVDFNENLTTAKLVKACHMSFDNTEKSKKISERLNKNDIVYVYPNESDEKYYKIKNTKGLVGYVKRDYVGELTVSNKADESTYDNVCTIEGKINLSFDHITRYAANNRFEEPVPEGVNVLCPTWFSFKDTNCTMNNIADKAYVDAAHKNGAQVWGLISDNFTNSISHSVISSSESRQKVIKQLLAYVALYELDGINIDFEGVPKADGEYYVQFLRELAPALREQGAVLSVDMFVPKSWTAHYRRAEVAEIVDYIIVMGYDEHYGGGDVSGSVASIDWSIEAIEATLKQKVPEEKLILAVPFYTRLWREEKTPAGVKVTSKAYGMDDAKELLEQKNIQPQWLEDIGQYYAEYEEDGAVYKIWLEDERSIRQRIALIDKYNIAGCAHWRRGFESQNIWPAIKEELAKAE